MKAIAGAFRNRAGYGGIMLVFVLGGLALFGVLLAPNLVLKVTEQKRDSESRILDQIEAALINSIERNQSIPAATNWWTSLEAIAPFEDVSATKVYTSFASDANTTRVLLIDPNLASGVLPYTQDASGLTGSQTNLVGANARIMLVSNARRSLTMPVTSGSPSSNAFHALWNWVYDPNTRSPPSGWPSAWAGNGNFLHVRRINLANEFHRVTCRSLSYGVGETNSATNQITGTIVLRLLRGTRLTLAQLNGTLKRIHVVNRDITFDFSGTNSTSAIGWWRFSEASGAVATNSGTYGRSANGIYTNGVTLGAVGPRPPTYSGYASNNTAISLDGVNDYVRGTNGMMNNLTGLTLAGWIYPTTGTLKELDLFGQEDIAQIGFTVAGKVEFWCADETKKLHYFYPHGANEWHHIAGVADGLNMYIYVDGVQVASRTYEAANFGSNTNPFNIGGNVFGSGQYFPGRIDEVIVFNRALSAAEVALVYQGQTL